MLLLQQQLVSASAASASLTRSWTSLKTSEDRWRLVAGADGLEGRVEVVCCSIEVVNDASGDVKNDGSLGSMMKQLGGVDGVVEARGRRGRLETSLTRAEASWDRPCHRGTVT